MPPLHVVPILYPYTSVFFLSLSMMALLFLFALASCFFFTGLCLFLVCHDVISAHFWMGTDHWLLSCCLWKRMFCFDLFLWKQNPPLQRSIWQTALEKCGPGCAFGVFFLDGIDDSHIYGVMFLMGGVIAFSSAEIYHVFWVSVAPFGGHPCYACPVTAFGAMRHFAL